MPKTLKLRKSSPLEIALQQALKGDVRFDDASRALYASDASNYRQIPIGVIFPKDKEDVCEALRICREYQVPILPRGAATSLAGQSCNAAVVFDMSKYMNKLLELNPAERFAVVEPGLVLDTLRNAAEKYELTFGPDPSTHNRCTLGGMIGNDSCGVHSIMSGKTIDNVLELEVITYDGEILNLGNLTKEEIEKKALQDNREGKIYASLLHLREAYRIELSSRFPRLPRRVSGYALDQLLGDSGFNLAKALVGTEGTCVTILSAKVRLIPSPQSRLIVVMGFEDIFHAADHVPEILKFKPIGLEGIDRALIENMKAKKICLEEIDLLPDGNGWLFVEFGANEEAAVKSQVYEFFRFYENKGDFPALKLFETTVERESVWRIREMGPGSTAMVPGKAASYPGWEDSAVPPGKLGGYLRDLYQLYRRYGLHGVLYGHFGDGCVHVRLDFDLVTAVGREKYRAFIYEAAQLVISYGGSLSGEHGDGQARAELLDMMYGEKVVEAFAQFKAVWDPGNKMNPGKVVSAYRMDENLKAPIFEASKNPQTTFKFPQDNMQFSKALSRCVGLGKCRKNETGTMCPSFQVTQDESYSTRGRAFMLQEMLQGGVIKDSWRNEQIRESLEMCLACKACKTECPTNVDMATYKAEFMSQYYGQWRRPLKSYFFGHIHRWSKLGSSVPALANWMTHSSMGDKLVRNILQLAPQRKLPRLADSTFKKWFFKREIKDRKWVPEVILWVDTFNNYYRPETLKAAVFVLEKAGFQVRLPKTDICCGRPYYDQGMLTQAKHSLRKTLKKMLNPIRRGVPIVGLEPSCISVFKDEMLNLFPHDMLALRLSRQIFLLSDFLKNRAKGLEFEKLKGEALIQSHCHQNPIFGDDSEKFFLNKSVEQVRYLDAGCCGMAGAFGYDAQKYDVSEKLANRVLLPAVNGCPKGSYIVANGYSCREQVEQLSDKKTFHLVEIMAKSLGCERGEAK